MLALFALNVYICHEYFHAEITKQTGSIEAAFFSLSRWLADHWQDRSWLPMWATGTPAREVYNPLLHHAVAWISLVSSWSIPHVYHFVTGTTYSLGPVMLFWLCYRWTGRLSLALLTGLAYSLISPSVFLVPEIRADAGGYLAARRLQTLVRWGEGPHVSAMTFIPFVIWVLDEAATRRRWMFLALAPFAVALIPLINWTGTAGLAMTLTAYLASKFGVGHQGERTVHWPTLIGSGVLAYALSSYWLPPSLVQTISAGSKRLDMSSPTEHNVVAYIVVAILVLALHWIFQKKQTPSILRFFIYLTCISGLPVIFRYAWQIILVPTPARFHLEMEMGIVGVLAYLALSIGSRIPRSAQIAAVALLAFATLQQTRHYHRLSRDMSETIDFSTTVEYKMSQWFAKNMDGRRVFGPGTASFWMNYYSDTPQLFGCCDQTLRTEEHRIANYVMYSSDGMGSRDGEITTLWLKAYGTSAIGVMGTGTSQFPQPYQNPQKFDGVLPELWRDGGSVIYKVPRANDSLAHVLDRSALMTRHPANGVDLEQLVPFLDALDHPSAPTTLRWINQHEVEIVAHTQPNQVVYFQETCDPGWHAYENGTERPVVCDILGFMTIDAGQPGDHTIRLIRGPTAEDRLTTATQFAGMAALAIWTWIARRRSLVTEAGKAS